MPARLDDEVEEEGELEVMVEDRPFDSVVHRTLKTRRGERLARHFAEEPTTDLQTGSHVRVRGVRVDNTLALGSGSGRVQALTAALPNTFGAQRTPVLLVNFQDKTTEPYPVATAQSVVFSSTSDVDYENSFQQTWLTGEVYGWFSLPMSSTVCDSAAVANYAQQAATAAGVNVSNYDRYVYAFPQNGCGYWGLGTVSGKPSQAWVNGSLQLMVVGHEMGHNFGLYHAHSLDCGGSCSGCDLGQPCATDADCISSSCPAGICAQPPTPLAPDCKAIKYDDQTIPNHINLVLVPSGFNGDMALFRQKAEWIASIFGNYAPFNTSIPEYNVFYVPKESGDYCYFNCSGIARLLCCDTSLARSLSSTCTTGARQTIVVENSGTYGGAGYTSSDVATTSINSSAPLVAVHEIGHSLFNLGDEYTSGTATPSWPNCDYTGCAKWQDMLGYNGVSCTTGNCATGSYAASENTIMKAMSYQFEEVNMRLSCCTYALETGSFPPYCDQFKRFTTTGDLSQFCQNPTGSGVGAVPGEYVEDPEEVTLSRDAATGAWQVDDVTRRRPGFYATDEVRGNGAGKIQVDVRFARGKGHQLRFASEEDVEFPGEGDRLGGTTPRPRNVVTVVVDRKGRGPIVSVQAREDGGVGGQ